MKAAGERNSQAQNEVSGRPAALNVVCDLRKSLGQRQQPVEAHALDLEARIGRGPARILKHGRDEPIIAGWKVASSCPALPDDAPDPWHAGDSPAQRGESGTAKRKRRPERRRRALRPVTRLRSA